MTISFEAETFVPTTKGAPKGPNPYLDAVSKLKAEHLDPKPGEEGAVLSFTVPGVLDTTNKEFVLAKKLLRIAGDIAGVSVCQTHESIVIPATDEITADGDTPAIPAKPAIPTVKFRFWVKTKIVQNRKPKTEASTTETPAEPTTEAPELTTPAPVTESPAEPSTSGTTPKTVRKGK